MEKSLNFGRLLEKAEKCSDVLCVGIVVMCSAGGRQRAFSDFLS